MKFQYLVYMTNFKFSSMSNWRSIKDFPNYEVSDQGDVRNVSTNCILNGTPDKGGYTKVELYVGGSRSTKKVHRLVAEAFVPNPNDLPEVDHINNIRDDNRVENLRWSTRQQQMFNKATTKGYCFRKDRQKFVAQIVLGGKHKHLGCYDTEAEARAAYLAAKQTMHIMAAKPPKIVVNVTLKTN